MTDIRDDEAAFIASLPAAAWPLRLPIIRHVRAAWATWCIVTHYEAMAQMGLINPENVRFDLAMRNAIWRGDR